MAKIAVELEQAVTARINAGGPGSTRSRLLGGGIGWQVGDVLCTSGPHDRRFEERHQQVSIAMVVAGTFQYRAETGLRVRHEVMTPGSLMLGSYGRRFDCGHDHAIGDRCIAFWYEPEYFERIASDAGVKHAKPIFPDVRIPVVRELSPLVAQACGGVVGVETPWDEISVRLAALAVQLVHGLPSRLIDSTPSSQKSVTSVLRAIERDPQAEWSLEAMAGAARLSPYHFLRTFETVAGVTPHQYVLRTRLREAATRIVTEDRKIVDVALECGFGDVSNFNRAFRTEFGCSPRHYRTAK
ncbi:MAG TPA: AraC family transcriptional regulator [Terriglobales bacterium]|nr:AraC family transcriptional regulator [Terriglobales bacterium]